MGGRMTLEELYVLVPSTEDYDLAEEAEVERLHARMVKEYVELLGPLDDDPLPGAAPPPPGAGSRAADSPDDPLTTEPEWRPTDAQALGCVEHLLGAQRVTDPADRGDPAGADPADPADTPKPPEAPEAPVGASAGQPDGHPPDRPGPESPQQTDRQQDPPEDAADPTA